jgi:hypothetical protein
MAILFVNNFSTTLGGALGSSSPGTTGQTVTLTTGQGANLPVIAAPDVMYLTINEGTNQEIILVTAHTSNADTITVTRGVEGIGGAAATAVAYTTAATIEGRITKGMLDTFAQSTFADLVTGTWNFTGPVTHSNATLQSGSFTVTGTTVHTGTTQFNAAMTSSVATYLSGTYVNDPIVLNAPATDPTAAASGTLKIYAKQIAGRYMPKWIGPAGVDVVAQAALFGNNIVMWTPNNATNGFWQGTSGSASGTFTEMLPTTNNIWTAVHRAKWANVVTTINQQVGQRGAQAMFFRGNSASLGGFFFTARFGIENWTAGDRLFVGLHSVTTNIVTTPVSASLNYCGFVVDAGESAITFQTNQGSGTATKTAIAGQPALSASIGFDAYIYCKPNDTTIYYRLDYLNTQVTLINSQSTATLPVNTTMMAPAAFMSNGANTAAAAAGIGVARIYVETDY